MGPSPEAIFGRRLRDGDILTVNTYLTAATTRTVGAQNNLSGAAPEPSRPTEETCRTETLFR
jgi:hypothetical protein